MTGRCAFLRMPAVLALMLAFACTASGAEPARPEAGQPARTVPFPQLQGLRPQVDFWIDVFARLHENEVVLHDTLYPALRYEVFTLPGTIESGLNREQRRILDRRRDLLSARLRMLEGKIARDEALDEAEQELRRQLQAAGPDAVAGAAQRVRAQRGLREGFLAGVRRSGRYLAQMRAIFAGRSLPEDLAYLPHVESSFNIEARSTAGAAGIWQFTRPTGRRYLHISNALDERLDPIAATHAAADYLSTAHDQLGDWALAITAYNHGTSGILRAAREHGADLERIVRDYRSDSFGFASRNFYTEFLAVREILDDPGRYFDAPLAFEPADTLDSLVLPRSSSASRLARLLDTDIATLATANPAWLDRTLQGRVSLPAGIAVRLPAGSRIDSAALTAQLQVAEHAAPPLPVVGGETYHVRKGDTLESIARKQGVQVAALRRANGIAAGSHLIRVGQRLTLPEVRENSRRARAKPVSKPELHRVRNGENPFTIARRYRISLDSLLAANGLDPNAIIRPGQHLRIPAAAKP